MFGLFALVFGSLFVGQWIENQSDYQLKLKMMQENVAKYRSETFLLKEMAQTDNYAADLQGEISGGLLYISGSIYGKLYQDRKITVVYRDNDNLYKITTFDLYNISISDTDGPPSFGYPKAYIEEQGRQLKLLSGDPVLYLPNGWQIIGTKATFKSFANNETNT